MIEFALRLLRDELAQHLTTLLSGAPIEVGFPDLDDSAPLKPNRITVLLLNLEQEQSMRPASPALSLTLTVLIAARFDDYATALRALSWVIQFFQSRPALDGTPHGGGTSQLGRLVIEPMTLPLAQQIDLWAGLKSPMLPAMIYRIRPLTFG